MMDTYHRSNAGSTTSLTFPSHPLVIALVIAVVVAARPAHPLGCEQTQYMNSASRPSYFVPSSTLSAPGITLMLRRDPYPYVSSIALIELWYQTQAVRGRIG
jgi:hypothetical protein